MVEENKLRQVTDVSMSKWTATLLAIAASACGTTYAPGVGPVIGYAFDKGLTIGVEGGVTVFPLDYLGASQSTPMVLKHFNLGMSYNLGGMESVPAAYLVWEPWAYMGATFGFAVLFGKEEPTLGVKTNNIAISPALGLWEGFALIPESQCSCENSVPVDTRTFVNFSLAVGYRYVGRHEIYFAPKVVFTQCPPSNCEP
jgi:hypothetical protein